MKNKNFRSDKARMQRSLDDMVRTRDALLKRAKKAKRELNKIHDKKEMKLATEAIHNVASTAASFDLVITMLESTYKSLGIDLGKPNPEPLTPKEEAEITALRYCGLQGKPLYTLKELARQYGTTVDVIKQIDYNAPM